MACVISVPGFVNEPTWVTKASQVLGSPHANWCMSVIHEIAVVSSGSVAFCAAVITESIGPVAGLTCIDHGPRRVVFEQLARSALTVHVIAQLFAFDARATRFSTVSAATM